MMIGVIGPADSTTLVETVAEDIGVGATLVTARYRNPSETGRLVCKLRPLCPVILFTGRLPYSLAVAEGFDSTGFEYIPHEGTDLFRTLTALALNDAYAGTLPKLSFDSMPRDSVFEAYAELGLKHRYHVIPLELETAGGILEIRRIIHAHWQLYETGAVDHCVTCINRVRRALARLNLPVTRIGHSYSSVRHALLRAQLLLELGRAEASQCAVGLISRPQSATKIAQDKSITSNHVLQLCADRFGAHLMRGAGRDKCFVTTRGGIELALSTLSTKPALNPESRFVLGIGTGPTHNVAEQRAKQACDLAISAPNVVLELKQRLTVPVAIVNSIQSREIRRSHVKTMHDFQVSPTLLARLSLIFREIDPAAFTADEFARSYNVRPRSARRVLTLLRERGLIEEWGLEIGKGAGRPKGIYRILQERFAMITK